VKRKKMITKLGIVGFLLIFSAALLCGCVSEPEPEAPQTQTVEVTLKNVYGSQPLAPGVLIVHTSAVDVDFVGDKAPTGLERLAEVGNPAEFAEYVETLPGVSSVVTTDAPILPGEQATVTLSDVDPDAYLSVLMMAVASNDGYAFVDAVKITDDAGNIIASTTNAVNLDAGTEENTELGSGFEGGQPDPAQGEANIENGVPTDEPVATHPQLTHTILQVVI
jgi:hypothetical protein